MSRKAGVISIDLNAGTAKFMLDMQAAEARIQQFGKTGASSMVATSGALRELEGNFGNNTRAVSRFLASTLGLGPALQAAFPIVGGVAFGGMVVDLGKKVYDFFKNVAEAPQKTAAAFRSLNDSILVSNEELRVSNERLEVEIAKLENRQPTNLLKLSLEETAKAAAELGRQLERDNAESSKLLKEHQTGFSGHFLNQPGIEDLQKYNERLGNQIHEQDELLRTATRNARAMAHPDAAKAAEDAAVKARNDAVLALLKKAEAYTTGIIDKYQINGQPLGAGTPFELDAKNKLAAANGLREMYQDEQDHILQNSRKEELEGIKATDEAAAEAARKRHEELVRRAEFLRRIDAYEREQFAKRLEEVSKLGDEARVTEESLRKQVAEGHYQLPGFLNNPPTSPFETIAEQRARLEHQARLGQIDVQADPKRMAQEELNARLTVIQILGAREKAMLTDNAEIQRVTDRMHLEAEQAAFAYEEKIASLRQKGIKDFFLEMQAEAQTAGNIMYQSMHSALDRTSDELARLLTGQKTSFGKMLQGIGQEMVHSSIKSLLQKAIAAIHHPAQAVHKPTGEASDPVHVWVENSAGAVPGKDYSPISGILTGAAAGAKNGVRGLFGGLLERLGGYITGRAAKEFVKSSISYGDVPQLAGGGDVLPGNAYWVGDGGEPELFTPTTAGTVTPASRLGSASDYFVYNIDSRGADLGAGNRVARAIEAAHTSAVVNSMRASAEREKRTPKRSGR